jgi:hypothetical protein
MSRCGYSPPLACTSLAAGSHQSSPRNCRRATSRRDARRPTRNAQHRRAACDVPRGLPGGRIASKLCPTPLRHISEG